MRRVIGLLVLVFACGELPMRPDFGQERILADHREVDITFTSGDATLAGTLYLPARRGRVAVAALNPGSSWTTRATWNESRFFIEAMNVGVFAYDRRGAGESTGACCAADPNEYFDQLANDLAAAVRAVRQSPLVDPNRVGVFGSSLGGWIAPLAANRARDAVSFAVVTVGGVVSTGQERVYDELTGYDACNPTGMPRDQILDSLRTLGPSGFDPHQSLVAMEQPAIWIYGGNDLSHPGDFSAELLGQADPNNTKDWTVVIIPDANHDLIENGSICQTDGPRADVISPLLNWWERRFP